MDSVLWIFQYDIVIAGSIKSTLIRSTNDTLCIFYIHLSDNFESCI